jgi:hypothetical protein
MASKTLLREKDAVPAKVGCHCSSERSIPLSQYEILGRLSPYSSIEMTVLQTLQALVWAKSCRTLAPKAHSQVGYALLSACESFRPLPIVSPACHTPRRS